MAPARAKGKTRCCGVGQPTPAMCQLQYRRTANDARAKPIPRRACSAVQPAASRRTINSTWPIGTRRRAGMRGSASAGAAASSVLKGNVCFVAVCGVALPAFLALFRARERSASSLLSASSAAVLVMRRRRYWYASKARPSSHASCTGWHAASRGKQRIVRLRKRSGRSSRHSEAVDASRA
jgi:hypothetical protein